MDHARFACRVCRGELFVAADLLPHAVGTHRLDAKKTAKEAAKHSAPVGCSSYFLAEPKPWMTADEASGKLFCPKCDTRIGSYHWSGAQCSCGSWVTPSFQVTMSRVDRKDCAADLAGIRLVGARPSECTQPEAPIPPAGLTGAAGGLQS